jgi:flagellar basal body rod protein FlgG
MASRASGSFEVKLTPQPPGESPIGRMTINKQFHGELAATSRGEMLMAGTAVKGSAGYVAIETVTGSLHGREGSFALQHNGTMTRGAPQLSVTVVPDSGTGQLTGLSGTMTIKITEGKHFYEFDYELGENR